jgi:hypothetical protein
MRISKRLLLGVGLATFLMESVVIQPALAADKVSLFKVITAKDEIVIGIGEADLAQVEGQNAGGVAKALVADERVAVRGAQIRGRRSRTGAAAQDRPDRQRQPARRALCDAAQGAADRRYEVTRSVIPGWSGGTRPGISRFRVRIFDAPRNDNVSLVSHRINQGLVARNVL